MIRTRAGDAPHAIPAHLVFPDRARIAPSKAPGELPASVPAGGAIKRRGRTAPFLAPDGSTLPGSVAEIHWLTLGGVDQWVMIRGRSVTNPPLVLLHGGPGFSESMLVRNRQPGLEDEFVVVYWDQRGAGHSYAKDLDPTAMTTEQFLADLHELLAWVRERTGLRQAVRFGHPWGSVLGPLYAARHPDHVAAYVGCGQLGDWPASERASYRYALTRARAERNRRAVEALQALGSPPHTAEGLWVQRTRLQKLEGQLTLRSLWTMGRALVAGPEASVRDLPGFLAGFRFSLDAMWDEVSRIDLLERVPSLAMPVFALLGREDHWVPSEISLAFLEALEAPSTEIVWFEDAGHEPFVDSPQAFHDAMVQVRRSLRTAAA